MNFSQELIRKGIHLCSVVFPLGYFLFSRETMLFFLGVLLIISFIVELARLRVRRFNDRFNSYLGQLLRDHEKKTLTGSTYLLMGAFLAILLFDQWIAVVVLLFLVVSDALGALAGLFWGGRHITGNKTVVGSVIFIVVSGVMVLVVPGTNIAIGLVGVFVAFLMEVFVKRVDDNLTIPLGAGGTMQILALIMVG